MTEQQQNLVNPILETITNKEIRAFATELIETLPPYIWEVGASSTGKYHPEYSLAPMGLMRHQVAVVRFMNFFFELEQFQNEFTSREMDLMRVAGFIHDGRKSGEQVDYERSKYTKFNHPIQMANIVRSYDGKYLDRDSIEFIAHCIESHMGAWNVDKKTGEWLPKPEDKYQQIVHLADYLASRKTLTMDFENIEKPRTVEINPEEYTLTFGKHKGLKLIDVYRTHPDYVAWLEENVSRSEVLNAIKVVKKKIAEEDEI